MKYEVDSDSRGVRLRMLDAPLREVRLPAVVEGTEIQRVFFEEGPEGVGGTFALEAGSTYGGVRASELDRPFRIVLDFDRVGGAQFPVAGPQPVAPPAFLPPVARGIRTVVLDPGHGGEELGAAGPTGLLEKSRPWCSTSSNGTTYAAGMVRSPRKGVNGFLRRISIVWSSTTRIPSTSSASPFRKASAPYTLSNIQVLGERVSGSSTRSKEYLKSVAVTFRPEENLTSSLSVNW